MGAMALDRNAWVRDAVRKIDADFQRSSDTHLIPLALPGFPKLALYLKDESSHPTGSLKHRLARSLFLYALCNGWIRENSTIVEASSGSTAISEAYFARLLGLPFVAVMPKSTSPEKIAAIEFYGGRCHLIDDPTRIYGASEELAREAGFTLRSVGMKRDGSLLEIEVMTDFRDLSVFASPALAVSADASQWSFVVPRDMTFKDGRFSASVKRDSAPARGHPIRASFPGREARFTVHLPGEVIQSNGTREERLASWKFNLESLCDTPVEMVAVSRSGLPYGTIALGVFLLLGLAAIIVSFLRKRPVQRPV